MKRIVSLLLILSVGAQSVACTVTSTKGEKLNDLEYTVVKPEELPDEVEVLIEENKGNHMKLSYTDKGILYVIVGYGEQKTSGYSLEVLEFYETDNVLYLDTNLLGPEKKEEVVRAKTYPYIVLQLEENEKPVSYN